MRTDRHAPALKRRAPSSKPAVKADPVEQKPGPVPVAPVAPDPVPAPVAIVPVPEPQATTVPICPVCGYTLSSAVVTHCDACGYDHTVAAGDRCPNPNCAGVLR